MNTNKKNLELQEVNKTGRKLSLYIDLSEIIHIGWEIFKRDFPNLSDYSFNVVGQTFKQIVFRICKHVMHQLKMQTTARDSDMDFALSIGIVLEQVITETGVIVDKDHVEDLTLRVVHGIEQIFMQRMAEECPVVYNEGYVQIVDFRIGTIVDEPDHLTAIIELLV